MSCLYCANLLAGKRNAPLQECHSPVRQRFEPVRSGFVAMLAFIGRAKQRCLIAKAVNQRNVRQAHTNCKSDEFTSSLNRAYGGAWVYVWALGLAWV